MKQFVAFCYCLSLFVTFWKDLILKEFEAMYTFKNLLIEIPSIQNSKTVKTSSRLKQTIFNFGSMWDGSVSKSAERKWINNLDTTHTGGGSLTYAKVPLGHYTVVTIWWFSLLQAHFTVHLRFQLPTEFRSRSCVIFPYLKTKSENLLSYQKF